MVAISEFPSIRLEFFLGVQLRGFSKHKRLLNPSAVSYSTSSRKIQFFHNVALIFILVAIILLVYHSILTTGFIIEKECQGGTARQSSTMKDTQTSP